MGNAATSGGGRGARGAWRQAIIGSMAAAAVLAALGAQALTGPAWAGEVEPDAANQQDEATPADAPTPSAAEDEATDEAPAEADEDEAATDADAAEPTTPAPTTIGRTDVTVIGSAEAARELPGSGYYLDTEDIRTQNYDDIHRILRKTPGVYVREEDGFGLFPNISIRGTDPGRSSKVTLMEDGVLIAPAPYSAPAAYNGATAGRMSAIEVLKGSSQVRYGPHITGGVVNYLATPIPTEQQGYLRTIYGSNHEIRVHGYFGDQILTDDYGTFSYLVEGYFRQTEGFKSIDSTPDYRGGDTGFRNVEPMIKIAWEPPTDVYQRFEFKYGHTNREADETYLGLAEEDYNADPYRRYQASRFDNFDAEANRTYLRHYIEPSEAFDLTTTLYYNDFARNWYKLASIEDGDGGSSSLSGALAGGAWQVGGNPDPGTEGDPLGVLRGEEEGFLRVRANNREYYSWGAESVGRWRFDTSEIDHELSVGVRYHYDQVRRFQHDDLYEQADNGTIVDMDPGAPGSQGNRRQSTDAVALFVQDEMDFGRLTLTPGVRFEHLWQEYRDYNSGNSGSGDLALVGGGIGATYDIDERWQLFGGVHRGFSPPAPGAAINDNLEEETSIATELGVRYASENNAFRAETAGFFTHFDDLIVTGLAGAGGVEGDPENVGKVHSYGAELLLEYDAGVDHNWGFSNPWFASFTYTNAELRSDTMSLGAESLFSGGSKGSSVPYIPEFAFTVGTGIEVDDWGVFLTGIWVDETYTTASNTSEQVDPDGDPDARFGKTDSYFVVDLSGHYRLTENAKLVGGVHNLFDEEYLTARHPHGARPGQPRFLYVGMELTF